MAVDNAEPAAPAWDLLRRSIASGRLAHAYLFCGDDRGRIEALACQLAQTLNCQGGPSLDLDLGGASSSPEAACGECSACRRIAAFQHPDVQWIRPESKLRVITIAQIREVIRIVNLKASEAPYKISIIVGADRLNVQAANAFLKTLEEPPARSIIILLSTQPDRLLETILSRCLRLNIGTSAIPRFEVRHVAWLAAFNEMACDRANDLFARYRLLDSLLKQLASEREQIRDSLAEHSPLNRYEDVDPKTRERWETEQAAAVESEYRARRSELLICLEWWLRDVWLRTRGLTSATVAFPEFESQTNTVAQRLSPDQALQNLAQVQQVQRLLATNVQEALALEVALIQLQL